MRSRTRRLGFYVSYNERENGDFADAVAISNNQGYVLWAESSRIDVNKFTFPAPIVVRISGEERYYVGKISEVRPWDTATMAKVLPDTAHRPSSWQTLASDSDVEHILYIEGLKAVPWPSDVAGMHPPQRPVYIELEDPD